MGGKKPGGLLRKLPNPLGANLPGIGGGNGKPGGQPARATPVPPGWQRWQDEQALAQQNGQVGLVPRMGAGSQMDPRINPGVLQQPQVQADPSAPVAQTKPYFMKPDGNPGAPDAYAKPMPIAQTKPLMLDRAQMIQEDARNEAMRLQEGMFNQSQSQTPYGFGAARPELLGNRAAAEEVFGAYNAARQNHLNGTMNFNPYPQSQGGKGQKNARNNMQVGGEQQMPQGQFGPVSGFGNRPDLTGILNSIMTSKI